MGMLVSVNETLFIFIRHNISYNINRKNKDLKFYEFGKTYHKLGQDHNEKEFNELLNMTLNFFEFDELNSAIDTIMQSSDRYQRIASICDSLFELANNGNEIAISIVQQGSQHIADMVIFLCDQISYINDELILIANGGVMNNSFFRKSLSDALSFDFTTIKWLFPTISSAYYPGLLSAKMIGMKVSINDIIENGEK